ncbi:hypothetical protein B296_00007390 [Ensete ventricosum]|uniref:threonine ammonia-lyase n=1 Tax=Ensete ventricosum TaxID=4639 RepID=A0A427AJK6_ENSVE|nr:hypothetical protein B296_00007390 [Ensete ventricosum]
MESHAVARRPLPARAAAAAAPRTALSLQPFRPTSTGGGGRARRSPLVASAVTTQREAGATFTVATPLAKVSADSLQYESGVLGAITERTRPAVEEKCPNGALTPIQYLTNVLSSRVYDVAIESPLQLAPKLSERLGVNLWLKREDLQPVFSFKLRGAYNMMVKLSREQLDKGVICSSAGNHAQGVALAAQKLHCDALIVMPVTTPEIKVKIIGVEPSDANAMALSLYHGQRIMLEHVGGFADGVAVKVVGEETFRLCRELVDGVVLVRRDAICASIKKRSILEPAGALSLAGAEAYCKYYGLKGANVVAITSGANMNFDRLRLVTELADVGRKREAVLATILPEEHGSFKAFCKLMGGRSTVQDELLCRFIFPERPGALMKFLDAFSPRWNISLFHYRAQGETGANVLVGIQVPKEDMREFKRRAQDLGYEYTYEMTDESYRLLMQ